MIFFLESVVICLLFTLAVKVMTDKKNEAFVNDYPPVVTEKLREKGLIAETPPPRKKDILRKAIATVVFAFVFALILRYVNGLHGFKEAALAAYLLWLVGDWYDFLVIDVLLACFNKFYRLSGVSAFDRSSVLFHFLHSLAGTLLGIPCALLAGFFVTLL